MSEEECHYVQRRMPLPCLKKMSEEKANMFKEECHDHV
jgi:hypothetical protein